jgi:hypothetical protein
MAGAARGAISPGEGVGLARLVETFVRTIETRDFDTRLQLLEEAASAVP